MTKTIKPYEQQIRIEYMWFGLGNAQFLHQNSYASPRNLNAVYWNENCLFRNFHYRPTPRPTPNFGDKLTKL